MPFEGGLASASLHGALRCRRRGWKEGNSERNYRWAEMIKQAAREASADLQPLFGRCLDISGECVKGGKGGLLDVHVQDDATGDLLIAFEVEYGSYKENKNGKGWNEEFVKLCATEADLRAIFAYMTLRGVGEKMDYLTPLKKRLKSRWKEFTQGLKKFTKGMKGEFLIILGPMYNHKNPRQPWAAYVLDPSEQESPRLIPLPPNEPFFACKYLGCE